MLVSSVMAFHLVRIEKKTYILTFFYIRSELEGVFGGQKLIEWCLGVTYLRYDSVLNVYVYPSHNKLILSLYVDVPYLFNFFGCFLP